MSSRELKGCITDVPGILLGHAQNEKGYTGCTVVLMEEGGIAGVDIGGSAPGMRETEMLNPTNMVMRIHAVMLTGGSTFGLNAAGGVQSFLEEKDIGFHASSGGVIPIVPTAVIFDMDVGKPRVYPDREMGYKACQLACREPSPQGLIGVGAGATCGKAMGSENSMRGGVGTASARLANGVTIGVLSVCNAWGDVINPRLSKIVAGARDPQKTGSFIDTEYHIWGLDKIETRYFGMDTTLCVVATDALFNLEQCTKIAMMGQDGIARAIRPSHTQFDGDVVFAISTSSGQAKSIDVNIAGSYAARLVEESIVRGVCAGNDITFEGYAPSTQPY